MRWRIVLLAALAVAALGERADARSRPRRKAPPALALAVPAPPPFLLPPPPPPPRPFARLQLGGQRFVTPQTRTSQAGLSWELTDRVSLQLDYERTGYAPLMTPDHDDGIVTGVRLRF
jgi:hypothetical protein